ncbi:MAG: hypothetical protein ACOWW1_05025 [archaeon]
MATKTVAKIQRELNSYQGLTTLNIVFGGLVMAFAISFIVQSINAMVQAQNLLIPQTLLAGVGFVAAGLAIRWLISSAELLEGVTDLKDEYNKNKTTPDNENTVNILVKMTAHYRQNKPTIKTMMTLSRIAGTCFLVSGAYILVTTAIGFSGFSTGQLFLQVLGAGFNLAMAGASFAIPHFFGKYSKIWDYRLEETMKAEKQLQQQFGDFEE